MYRFTESASLPGSSRKDSQSPAGWRLLSLDQSGDGSMAKETVYPTTGGVTIDVNEHFVVIEQEDLNGGDPGRVDIAVELFSKVLDAIFVKLDSTQLKQIRELIELHVDVAEGHEATRGQGTV
jgi:hypothetical protein